MSGMPLLKSAIPFGQSENRFCNQSTKIGCFVGTGVESIQPPKPFQAEHTPAVIQMATITECQYRWLRVPPTACAPKNLCRSVGLWFLKSYSLLNIGMADGSERQMCSGEVRD